MCPIFLCVSKKSYVFRETNARKSARRNQSVTAQQTKTTTARKNNNPPSPFTSMPPPLGAAHHTQSAQSTQPSRARKEQKHGAHQFGDAASEASPGFCAELLENPDAFFRARKFKKEGLGKDGSSDLPKCHRKISTDHIVLN